VEAAGELNYEVRRALAFGRVSAEDAAIFCAASEHQINELKPLKEYLEDPASLPTKNTARWFIISRIREKVEKYEFPDISSEVRRSSSERKSQ
jgi:hypothetical protein